MKKERKKLDAQGIRSDETTMQRTVGKVQSSCNRFVLPAVYQHTDPGIGGGKGKEYCDGHRCQGGDRWN